MKLAPRGQAICLTHVLKACRCTQDEQILYEYFWKEWLIITLIPRRNKDIRAENVKNISRTKLENPSYIFLSQMFTYGWENAFSNIY